MPRKPGVAKTQLRAMPRNAFGVSKTSNDLCFLDWAYPEGTQPGVGAPRLLRASEAYAVYLAVAQ